jgi:N-acetyl-anhydromuramyl-L-alanine amidase AmpD
MEIINAGLDFRSLTERSRTDMCILHHTACSVASPEDIHRWHLANGWSGAGYNLYVRKDGTVYELRPMNCVGAHAQGYNSISIGVCFEGNFEEEDMTDAQVESGKQVVAYVKSVYGDIPFKGHRDVNSTSCPGANFKFDEIVYGAPVPSPEPTPEPSPTPSGDGTIADIQGWLNGTYGFGIAEDGFCGPITKKAMVKALQTEFNTQFDAGLAVDRNFWHENL